VVDSVVERFDVNLHDPVRTAVYDLPHLLHRLMGTAFGSEPVRAGSEAGFEDGLQDQLGGGLGYPVAAESYRKLGVHLTNGSRIEALPGTEKTIRGFSGVDLLIVDEASRVEDELYFAVRPMLAISGGKLMMLSTPYGKRGVFYDEWHSRVSEWERYQVPAIKCPRITAAFLAEERAALPLWVYRQEYECSFEETEDQVFTTDMVDAAVSSEVTPLFGSGA